ncbi:MAG: hypothetical protein IJF92_01355 [Bacilli bacterium]|nr:hypothetical protein [Bacilli bacterium]
MKKIKLIFTGLGYNNRFQAYTKIYNSNNKLIYEGKTYNGELELCLKKNNCYRLEAISKDEIIDIWFYVNKTRKCYLFKFRRSIIENNPITFLLTDYYYSNLPIEKGELILWQK